MSGEEGQTELRFSRGFTAFQTIGLAFIGAMFAYMANQYLFNFAAFSAEHHSSPRYAWLEAITGTNGGKTGAVIWALFTLLACWYTWIAAWQFLTGRKAVLTERGLPLHRSYRRGGEIPYADVRSATVGEGRPRLWLFKRRRLRITFTNRREVLMRSLSTEGGKGALKAFARELNARRKAGGESPA